MGQRQGAIGHLYFWMGLAAQLARGLDNFGDAAPVCGMVVAEPAAIGVERQLARAGDQVAIGDEGAPLALLAEAEIFQGFHHGDGEAVVD